MEETNKLDAPSEWADDETMTVLFSPFRESRQVNPNGWDSKLRFWIDSITSKCLSMRKAVIRPRDLPKLFERKGKTPFCLDTVVTHMIKNGQLCKLSAVDYNGTQSWSSWTYDTLLKRPAVAMFNVFVIKPAVWTYSKLFGDQKNSGHRYQGITDSSPSLSDEEYVVMEVIKHLGDEIMKTYFGETKEPNPCRLVAMTTLREMCRKCCPCDLSFELTLSWLCAQHKCLVIEIGNQGKVVAFADPSKKTCEPPTEEEIAVFKLNCTSTELEKQINIIQQEVESLRTEAKMYLQKGMKTSAKNCLRRKKRLEKQLEKKETAIENIHQLVCTIKETETTKQVLDVYSSSVAAYKDFTTKQGLTVESVDDVMLGIQEVMDTQEELDRSLATSVTADDVTFDDLEKELNDILQKKDGLTKLPQVEPHQDLINAVCKLRICTDDINSIPAASDNLPGVSRVAVEADS